MQIFLTIVVALLIKSDQLTKELEVMYDWALFSLFMLFVPVTFLITITFKFYKIKTTLEDTHTKHMKHPNEWYLYNKYRMAVSNDQDNRDLMRWALHVHEAHAREKEIQEHDMLLNHGTTVLHKYVDEADEEFDRIDKDGSGTIDRYEIRAYMIKQLVVREQSCPTSFCDLSRPPTRGSGY